MPMYRPSPYTPALYAHHAYPSPLPQPQRVMTGDDAQGVDDTLSDRMAFHVQASSIRPRPMERHTKVATLKGSRAPDMLFPHDPDHRVL